jgi:hypothetical protein
MNWLEFVEHSWLNIFLDDKSVVYRFVLKK